MHPRNFASFENWFGIGRQLEPYSSAEPSTWAWGVISMQGLSKRLASPEASKASTRRRASRCARMQRASLVRQAGQIAKTTSERFTFDQARATCRGRGIVVPQPMQRASFISILQ